MLLAPARGAVRSDKKIGLRFGWDKTTPLGYMPIVGGFEPTLRKLPIPILGFGLTAIPIQKRGYFMIRESQGVVSIQPVAGHPKPRRKPSSAPWQKTGKPIGGRPPLPPPAPKGGMGGKPPEAQRKPAAGERPIVGAIKNTIIADLLNSYTIAAAHGCMELQTL